VAPAHGGQGQFKQARPTAGEIVAVRYLGKRTSAEGRSYHAWRVSVAGRENAKLDWDNLDAGSGYVPAPDDSDQIPFLRGEDSMSIVREHRELKHVLVMANFAGMLG
jgi:hypothetical protein